MRDNIWHFKGVKEETPEEKKKRKQREFKRQWNKYVLRRTEAAIIEEINK